MEYLEEHITELTRSINRYGKENVSADEILAYLEAIHKALEEIQPSLN